MEKLKLLILLIFVSCISARIANDKVPYDDTVLIPFQSQGKWGFVDTLGNIYIKPIYDSLGFFYNGIAKVKIGENYGLLKKDNSFLLKPKFQNVTEFYSNFSEVTKNGVVSYVDPNAKSLKTPQIEDGYCSGGLTTIIKGKVVKINDKYELVYKCRKRGADGNSLIANDTTCFRADSIIDFSNMYIQIMKMGKTGIVKFDGRTDKHTILRQKDLKYDSIVFGDFYKGDIRFAKAKADNLWGIISGEGKELIEPHYLEIITAPVKVRDPIAFKRMNSKYKRIYMNHKNLLVEYSKNKYGYINMNGKEFFKR